MDVLWVLARGIEAVWVVRDLLDPRMRGMQRRVRAMADGALAKESGKAAILVLYADGRIPAFTRSFIDAISRSDFNLVAVSNRPLDAAERAWLLDRCRLLIERDNFGRDFGAYQDGIAIARERLGPLRRLILANDSVFFLPPGLDATIAQLDEADEFIGVSEVFQHHYHVASFLMSFGPAVLESDAFRGFWSRYRAVGTRRWAILRGEGALTSTLVAAGFGPRILYRTDELRRCLDGLAPAALSAEIGLLPPRARAELLGRLGESGTAVSAADIADAVHTRNQMHAGGFLFRRHLGLPLVKRDLAYRGIYPVDEVLANLTGVEPAMREAMAADLRSRPDPTSYRGLAWVFHRFGVK